MIMEKKFQKHRSRNTRLAKEQQSRVHEIGPSGSTTPRNSEDRNAPIPLLTIPVTAEHRAL